MYEDSELGTYHYNSKIYEVNEIYENTKAPVDLATEFEWRINVKVIFLCKYNPNEPIFKGHTFGFSMLSPDLKAQLTL